MATKKKTAKKKAAKKTKTVENVTLEFTRDEAQRLADFMNYTHLSCCLSKLVRDREEACYYPETIDSILFERLEEAGVEAAYFG